MNVFFIRGHDSFIDCERKQAIYIVVNSTIEKKKIDFLFVLFFFVTKTLFTALFFIFLLISPAEIFALYNIIEKTRYTWIDNRYTLNREKMALLNKKYPYFAVNCSIFFNINSYRGLLISISCRLPKRVFYYGRSLNMEGGLLAFTYDLRKKQIFSHFAHNCCFLSSL